MLWCYIDTVIILFVYYITFTLHYIMRELYTFMEHFPQGIGEVPVPGVICVMCGHGSKVQGLVMGLGRSGWWLNLIQKVFSNWNDSMILLFYLSYAHKHMCNDYHQYNLSQYFMMEKKSGKMSCFWGIRFPRVC